MSKSKSPLFRLSPAPRLWLAVGALVLAGCGGSSGVLGTNSYPGTWSGTITGNTTGTGTAPTQQSFNIVINSSGAVTGTDTFTIPGSTTTDTGSISSNGDLSLAVYRTGTMTQIASLTATLEVIDNSLEGAGTLVVGTTSTPVSIALGLTSTATVVVKSAKKRSL